MGIEFENKNIMEVEVLEDQDGQWGVYFTVIDCMEESFFMESELREMLKQIEVRRGE